jgi:hypothetical protein
MDRPVAMVWAPVQPIGLHKAGRPVLVPGRRDAVINTNVNDYTNYILKMFR